MEHQYSPLSTSLCKQLLQNPELQSKLLILQQLKDLASKSSGIQLQIINEKCIPVLVNCMEEGREEEKVLATTIIMKCALLGSKEIVEAGGVLPLVEMLREGSEQTVALSVQTIWMLLFDRNTHEPVVCYGGMQPLIAIAKKSGVIDEVKDLAAQALFLLWSEEVIELEPDKCNCLSSSRLISATLPKEFITAISIKLDKLSSIYKKITVKALNHSSTCINPDMYTLQPALLNVFWIVHHLEDDVIQASCHEFGLQMIAVIWMQNDPLLTGIALDILSLLLKKGMIPSPKSNLLLSLLPTLAQEGDLKIQEKIQYCAQFAPKKEFDRAREDLAKMQLESLNKEMAMKEQNEMIAELRRQLMEREILLNDFVQNHRLAENLRKLEEANRTDVGSEKNYLNNRIEELNKQVEELKAKLEAAKKRNRESKQKIKKAEEKSRQIEKIHETTVKDYKSLQETITTMEEKEKHLLVQLQQSKLILQKKLLELTDEKRAPSVTVGSGAKFKDSKIFSEADLVCPICMEQKKNVALDACGHTLCKGCAGMILSIPNKKCPICRKGVKTANPFYL